MQKIIHWSFKLINLLLKGEITLTFNINNQLFFFNQRRKLSNVLYMYLRNKALTFLDHSVIFTQLHFPPYKYVKKFEITVYDKKDVKKSFLYELLIYRRLYYDIGFIFFSMFFKNYMKICTLYRYVCTGM